MSRASYFPPPERVVLPARETPAEPPVRVLRDRHEELSRRRNRPRFEQSVEAFLSSRRRKVAQ